MWSTELSKGAADAEESKSVPLSTEIKGRIGDEGQWYKKQVEYWDG